MKHEILSITGLKVGRYSYQQLTVYTDGTKKDGSPVWVKSHDLGIQSTRGAKYFNAIAKAESERLGIPLDPTIRQWSPRAVAA